MDVLDLRFEPANFPTGADQQLVPFINGESLLAMSVSQRNTKTVPGHAGLAVYDGDVPELSGLEPQQEPHETAVLGCICGDAYCSPVLATISVKRDAVVWSVAGREFVFERRQYERAIRTARGRATRA